ncbi:MAG: hypothetical protein R6W86_13615 [Marinobacter sp.]|uniref:hypothetical protein n=1 Tax=Marinobacter sp. TaxID=50741 RepID=UPI00396E8EB3
MDCRLSAATLAAGAFTTTVTLSTIHHTLTLTLTLALTLALTLVIHHTLALTLALTIHHALSLAAALAVLKLYAALAGALKHALLVPLQVLLPFRLGVQVLHGLAVFLHLLLGHQFPAEDGFFFLGCEGKADHGDQHGNAGGANQ